jgi:hypothetical protein
MSENVATPRTNAVAMVAIVLVFFNPIAGLILAHIALIQIKRTNEAGRTAALVAAIVGWVLVSALALGLIVALFAGAVIGGWGAGLLG